MIKYGQNDKPVWVTEWGWSTDKVSQQNQSDWLEIALELLMNTYTYVTIATYFIDIDIPPTYYHGLLSEDYVAKPAAETFRKCATSLKYLAPPKNLRIPSQ